MNDCVFCRIVSGDLPCAKVYEDDAYVAFLDIHPTTKGHTLVIPKQHVASFVETDPLVLSSLMKVTQKIAKTLMEVVPSPAVNIEINNGKESGQVIFHTHIHIIPRFVDDGLKHWPQGYTYADKEMMDLSQKIRERGEQLYTEEQT